MRNRVKVFFAPGSSEVKDPDFRLPSLTREWGAAAFRDSLKSHKEAHRQLGDYRASTDLGSFNYRITGWVRL